MGGYKLIFDGSNPEMTGSYNHFCEAATEIWEEFTTGAKTRKRRQEVEEEKAKREKDKVRPFVVSTNVKKSPID